MMAGMNCAGSKLHNLSGMQGFKSVYKPEERRSGARSFAELLHECAVACPEMRIRFTSPHPKDFSDDVLQVRFCLSNIDASCQNVQESS